MKVIVLLLTSFLTSAAFASKTTIYCAEKGNSALRLEISYDRVSAQISGVSLYDTGTEQTAKSNFVPAIGQYTYYSYFISVALADRTEILIPGVLLDGKTKGMVHTGDGREFNCN